MALALIGSNILDNSLQFQHYLDKTENSIENGHVTKLKSFKIDKIKFAIAKALDVLDVEIASKLRQLVIFQKSSIIPLQPLTILWQLNESQIQHIMDQMAKQSLIMVRKEGKYG